MKPQTTMEDGPVLSLPLQEPTPPADCGVCAALVQERSAARARDDLSRVSDLNIEIRNHTHEPPRRKRRKT